MKQTQDEVTQLISSLLQQGSRLGDFTTQSDSATDIQAAIYQRLTSKKFRKTKMDEACVARTQHAIAARVANNEPLKVMYPQGGYKLWRFPSSPEADWAEFFTIAYLVEYLLPIARQYKPGVELVFYMHTLLMEVHDNLTTQEIQAYVDSFQKLIGAFSEYLPGNFKISMLRDADLYSREEYFETLEQGRSTAEQQYASWDEAKKQTYLRMAALNIKWDGKEQWHLLSEAKKQQKLHAAAVYELAAVSSLEKVAKVVKAPENVLVFTKATPDFIGIGSLKNSVAKYWVGFGVLETNQKGELKPRILSPSQYERALTLPYETVPCAVLPGKNFTKCLVFAEPFSF